LNKSFNYTIILGGIYGVIVTVVTFVLLGICVEKATTLDPVRAKRYMQKTYILRYLLTLGLLIIPIYAPFLNVWIVVLSIFSPRITYFVIGIAMELNYKKSSKKLIERKCDKLDN
ncbi:MAG: ATP synthase subunit I, partial [Oscillospiraceae bacterium]